MRLPRLVYETSQSIPLSKSKRGRVPVLKLDDQDPYPPPPGEVIAFKMYEQDMPLWCWAAVAMSIKRHYSPGNKITQCKLAELAGLGVNCCPKNKDCDDTYRIDKALTKTGNLNPPTYPVRTISWEKVRKETYDKKLVVACKISWTGSDSTHAVVISGAYKRNNKEYLVIQNPNGYARQERLTYQKFKMAYRGTGGWTETHLTKK